MKTLENKLSDIKRKIELACEKSGRNSSKVKLVAVTKTVDESIINESIELGVENVAENRVQEIVRKYPQISSGVKWHMIGHLQRNKVRQIIDKVDLIHSLDSVRLAQEINFRANNIGKVAEALIQINIGGENQKTGLDIEELEALLEYVEKCENLKVVGLMAIMPFIENPELVRPYFVQMKKIFDDLKQRDFVNIEMRELSMGMSHDFEVAIEEGATIVRIGSAIYK